jgi:hypothetical protein
MIKSINSEQAQLTINYRCLATKMGETKSKY